MRNFKIVKEAAPEQDWLVYSLSPGRPVTVRAPDEQVALFRANRLGVRVSGAVKPVRGDR